MLIDNKYFMIWRNQKCVAQQIGDAVDPKSDSFRWHLMAAPLFNVFLVPMRFLKKPHKCSLWIFSQAGLTENQRFDFRNQDKLA